MTFGNFFFGKTTIRQDCISAKRRFDEMTFRENDVAPIFAGKKNSIPTAAYKIFKPQSNTTPDAPIQSNFFLQLTFVKFSVVHLAPLLNIRHFYSSGGSIEIRNRVISAEENRTETFSLFGTLSRVPL